MSDVSLTAGMRTNLLQLQQTSKLMDMTQNRIATGKKINSALDGPSAFFAAKALTDRAADLAGLKDGMGQAISTIKAADDGIKAITSLVQQAKGLTASALQNMGDDANAVATRKALAASFNALLGQIDDQAADATYAGKNLLQGGDKVEMSTTARAAAADALNVRGVSVTGATATDTFTTTVRSGDLMQANAGSVSSAQANLGVTSLSVNGFNPTNAENVRIAVVDNSIAANTLGSAAVANQHEMTQTAALPTRDVDTITFANGTDQQLQQVRLNIGDVAIEFRSLGNVANTFEFRVSTNAGADFGAWTANGTAETAAEWGAQVRDTLTNQIGTVLSDQGYSIGGAGADVIVTGRHDGTQTPISTEVIIAGAGGMTAGVAATTPHVEARGQIVEMNLDLGGTIREGSRYVVEVNGQEFSHVVEAGATSASDVLAGLVGQINNHYSAGEIVAGTNGNNLTLTGMAAIIDPTNGSTTQGHVSIAAGGRTESVQLTISARDDGTLGTLNGTTVVHTNATSQLSNIQIGTNDAYLSLNVNNFAQLQAAGGSNVDIAVSGVAGQQVTVADSAGNQVTRSTIGTTDATRLSTGSNSFAFGSSGTVRINVDDLAALTSNVGSPTSFSTETLADTANDLRVRFNETGSSSVTIMAANVSTSGLGIEAATGEWGTLEDIEAAVAQLDQALVKLRQVSTELASNLSVVNTREDFTNNFINTLQEGADKLVLADSNEEGANMLMLQTRQQLGTISLSMASQSAQSILRLF